jgi:hypothetical protein
MANEFYVRKGLKLGTASYSSDITDNRFVIYSNDNTIKYRTGVVFGLMDNIKRSIIINEETDNNMMSTGNDNTFVGHVSGDKNTTGSCNTFYGSYAGCSNITGSSNIFIGA